MRDLNFHHLFYFWTVAKEGHLTRAAEQLHVSQSALSAQIKQLETRLGQSLFDREGRSLQLTEFGHLVLGYAERIFNLGHELVSLVERGETKRVQSLRIGAVATLSRNFQDNLVRPLLSDQSIRLSIQSSGLNELIEQLRVHKLDVILSNRPVSSDPQTRVRCKLIAQQGVCLVGPESAELSLLEFPRDLTQVRVIVPGPSSDIRTQFDMYCAREGIQVKPFAEVDDMAMLRLLARDTDGVTVVPEVVVQDELKTGRLRKYCTLEGVVEKFYAITAKREFETPLLSRLLG